MVTGSKAFFPDGAKDRHFISASFIAIGTARMEDTARRDVERTGYFA